MTAFFKSAVIPAQSPAGEPPVADPTSGLVGSPPVVGGAGVKCDLLKVGYMDDPFNTDNAWKELELWHIHYTGAECLSDKMQLNSIHWRIVTEDVFTKLPSGQAALMQDLTNKLKPTIL